jgi:lysophospholipase L1-like esterase
MAGLRILCLGDSYTIGELMPASDNFPNQLRAMLEANGSLVEELTIIAKTGDTTFELMEKIVEQKPHAHYHLVTLLIGVNNQYRNLSVDEYAEDFENLLQQSIDFADGNAQNVIVLSIPDWGLTPFNTNRDVADTSEAIDEFNIVNKVLTNENGCKYIDVTISSRLHAKDPNFLATDLLHYGKAEYAIWAKMIFKSIK